MWLGLQRGAALRFLSPLLVAAAIFLWLSNGGGDTDPSDAGAADTEQGDADAKLSITWLEPVEAHPGAAVIAHTEGLLPDGEVTARVSGDFGKQPAPVLRRDGSRLAIRIPREASAGGIKLRIYQGDRKSKPRLMQVRPIALRDLARDAIGGLAILMLGLALVRHAFRGFAGKRLRVQLARLTQHGGRSLGLGAAVGGLTQSTTSSSGILLGMLGARLLPQPAALNLLLGVQIGAATAGALLPLFASREALWVVALGGAWTLMAGDRHAEAFGRIVLGCGLLFVGLSAMQTGVRPLLSEPAILPYLHGLSAGGGLSVAAMIALGAALSALLQGPGPAFAVVLSLTQSTGLLSLSDGLLVLAGTPLGATLATVVLGLGYRAGQTGPRLALSHVIVGSCMTLVAALGVPLWALSARALIGGDPATMAYGDRILRPEIAAHLGAAFVIGQVVAVICCLPLRGAIARVAVRLAPAQGPPVAADDQVDVEGGLLPVLCACRTAILSLGEVIVTRDRKPAVAAERSITEARSAVTALLRALEQQPEQTPVDLATVTACLHLATATDGALRVAERALELDLATDKQGAEHLARVQALLIEGMEALVGHAEGRCALSLEDVQAREIRLNALEAEARATAGSADTLSTRLWMSELSSACEAVGNHIYRLGTALAATPFTTESG